MSGWAAKRFWTAATAEACEGGFTVRLDGRPVRTPGKAPLVVPTLALAQAIAAEWDAQTGKVRPETMPCTRAANSAIDKLSVQGDEVVAMLAASAETDLLCHRAPSPAALVARQAAAWDPALDWACGAFGARLRCGPGVVPVAQDPAALAQLKATVAALSRFELAAFHDLVAISGSLVLALAVIHGRMTADEAFAASRIDETWQAEQWGRDEDAEKVEALRLDAFRQADRFFGLCR